MPPCPRVRREAWYGRCKPLNATERARATMAGCGSEKIFRAGFRDPVGGCSWQQRGSQRPRHSFRSWVWSCTAARLPTCESGSPLEANSPSAVRAHSSRCLAVGVNRCKPGGNWFTLRHPQTISGAAASSGLLLRPRGAAPPPRRFPSIPPHVRRIGPGFVDRRRPGAGLATWPQGVFGAESGPRCTGPRVFRNLARPKVLPTFRHPVDGRQ